MKKNKFLLDEFCTENISNFLYWLEQVTYIPTFYFGHNPKDFRIHDCRFEKCVVLLSFHRETRVHFPRETGLKRDTICNKINCVACIDLA